MSAMKIPSTIMNLWDPKRMDDIGVKWQILTATGRQLGPYSTEAVLRLIKQGALDGSEQIKKHPDGRWHPISKKPEFYDHLLEVL